MSRRLLLQSLLAALAVGGAGHLAAQDKPIRIGYSMAKTGLFAPAAPSQLNAYELWREQVNARGGLALPGGKKRLVEFVQYDDQSNPAQAVKIYEKLITGDQVDLLVAPWGTPHHMAIAPVLERYKFPMVGNTAASVAIRELKPGYIWFPTSCIPDRQANELVALMKASGVKSAALLSNVLPFSKEMKSFLQPALKQAGIELKVDANYPPDVKDMTAMLTQVKAAKPDAVIALSYPGDSVLYTKQAKELGIDAAFQFVMVGPTMAFYPAVVGNAANGIVTMGHWSPHRKDWSRAKPFFEQYEKKFKEEPDYLDTALAYMSLEILEQAVAKAGLDRAKLRETIASGNFETINGRVRFDGVQNAVTPTALLQRQKGQVHLVWPKAIATSGYQPKRGWE